MYLVDTNVISEVRKGKKANAGVKSFFENADEADLYLSVQTIGEIRNGVEKLKNRGDIPQSQKADAWLTMLVSEYSDRILQFDTECAQVWGKLMAVNNNSIDMQIAAIALIHDLTVVTRNVGDFNIGIQLLNPFK